MVDEWKGDSALNRLIMKYPYAHPQRVVQHAALEIISALDEALAKAEADRDRYAQQIKEMEQSEEFRMQD